MRTPGAASSGARAAAKSFWASRSPPLTSASAAARHLLSPSAARLRDIARLVARVTREVLAWAKLRRVDEYRQDHDVGAGACRAHEREVTFVERAHRRDDRDAPAVTAQIFGARTHLRWL